MDFMRGKRGEDTEINLIPMIDVLLVILIFLAVTTTFSQMAELKINLPEAQAEKQAEKRDSVSVTVDANGRYLINNVPVAYTGTEALGVELRKAAGGKADPTIIINADAHATHQAVINVMEAARLVGYTRITFTTQTH